MLNSVKILEVIRIGHPTLAKPAKPVADPTANDVKQIIENMKATLDALGGGAGLAAPQVNIPLRLLIFCIPKERADDGVGLPLTTIINPVIEYILIAFEIAV